MSRIGRPKQENSKETMLSSRFTKEEFDEISLFCSLENMSKSEYLRHAVHILNTLNRNKHDISNKEDTFEYDDYNDLDKNEDDFY